MLEPVHANLPERGRKGVLDFGGQHPQPHLRVRFLRHQRLEHQHLAEHRRSFCGGQRGVRLERALDTREFLMDAVAELVRQRHHVARPALEVEEDVRVHRGHGPV